MSQDVQQQATERPANVRLVPFGSKVDHLLREAVRIYATVWQRDQEDSFVFFRNSLDMPEHHGFVALLNERAVGFAWGTASLPGQWWHDKVAERVDRGHPALQNAWVLTELAVLAPYRNQHIGGLLHDRILREQPFPNALLSTQVSNDGARRFYEERGWRYLHRGFAFQRGNQPYAVMYKRVRT